jgi:hypothetical protein
MTAGEQKREQRRLIITDKPVDVLEPAISEGITVMLIRLEDDETRQLVQMASEVVVNVSPASRACLDKLGLDKSAVSVSIAVPEFKPGDGVIAVTEGCRFYAAIGVEI